MSLVLLLIAAGVIALAVGIAAHKQPMPEPPAEPPPPEYLASMDDAELRALVSELAYCRELEPWPWNDWLRFTNKPDEQFRLRQHVWRRFERRPQPSPVVLPWYGVSRLIVQMGNELSRSLFVIGAFESNEFAFLDRYLKPGMVFVDAGANEGIYALFAALRVGPEGRVFAIEPSARERDICQANLDLNGCAAAVLPYALGDADGQAELILAQDHRAGHNTLGAFAWDGVHVAARQTVPMRSFDSLAAEHGLDRLDVLKMDIEGAEMRALRGGSHVFRDLRPVVILEVAPLSLQSQGSSRDELLAGFEALGYEFYHFDVETAKLMPGADAQTGDNLVAVPKEIGVPSGIRTRVIAVKGRCPRPG